MSKNKKNFVIRHATSLDDLQWVMRMAAEEGFTPREKEAECYFTAGLTPYFYIGELNGEKLAASRMSDMENLWLLVATTLLLPLTKEQDLEERYLITVGLIVTSATFKHSL